MRTLKTRRVINKDIKKKLCIPLHFFLFRWNDSLCIDGLVFVSNSRMCTYHSIHHFFFLLYPSLLTSNEQVKVEGSREQSHTREDDKA